jgi:hypothetical protein
VTLGGLRVLGKKTEEDGTSDRQRSSTDVEFFGGCFVKNKKGDRPN